MQNAMSTAKNIFSHLKRSSPTQSPENSPTSKTPRQRNQQEYALQLQNIIFFDGKMTYMLLEYLYKLNEGNRLVRYLENEFINKYSHHPETGYQILMGLTPQHQSESQTNTSQPELNANDKKYTDICFQFDYSVYTERHDFQGLCQELENKFLSSDADTQTIELTSLIHLAFITDQQQEKIMIGISNTAWDHFWKGDSILSQCSGQMEQAKQIEKYIIDALCYAIIPTMKDAMLDKPVTPIMQNVMLDRPVELSFKQCAFKLYALIFQKAHIMDAVMNYLFALNGVNKQVFDCIYHRFIDAGHLDDEEFDYQGRLFDKLTLNDSGTYKVIVTRPEKEDKEDKPTAVDFRFCYASYTEQHDFVEFCKTLDSHYLATDLKERTKQLDLLIREAFLMAQYQESLESKKGTAWDAFWTKEVVLMPCNNKQDKLTALKEYSIETLCFSIRLTIQKAIQFIPSQENSTKSKVDAKSKKPSQAITSSNSAKK